MAGISAEVLVWGWLVVGRTSTSSHVYLRDAACQRPNPTKLDAASFSAQQH